jgi:Ca2+-transporting ATPase
VALFAVAILAGLGVPMTVVQVLVINVLTDGLPAVALTRDPAEEGTMRHAPDRSSQLFPLRAWAALAAIGVLVGLVALGAFLLGGGEADLRAQTMAFVTIAAAELTLVFAVRSPIHPAWEAPRNLYLVGAVVVSALLVGAALYVPPLNDPLGTVPLSAWELALAVLLALVPAACVEVGKAVMRRAGWTLGAAA